MEGKRLTSYAMEELECPKCGHKHSLRKYKVINVTEKAKLKEEIIDKRLVDNINDLKEKIMIVDNHLDDRVIEIIKIMYLDQIKKEMEDDTLLNILFDYNRDNYCFLVFFQKKGIGKIPLTREFYRQVEDKYKEAIKEHSTDGFMKIDMEWAGKILFKNHNKFN